MPIRFAFAASDAEPVGDARSVVFVDGAQAGYRSLSHWPGNTTPAALKHDLSTGIALEFVRSSPERQTQLVGPFEIVANNHYDTDGVLSVFAVLHPEKALPRADLMLRAAATGDFATWQGRDALAVELSVSSLVKHPDSPLAAECQGMPDPQRWERGYQWLMEELPAILDDPMRYSHLWADRLARIEAEVADVQAGRGLAVECHADLDLAVVTSERPLCAYALHLAAGSHYRVLQVLSGRDGQRYHFCYRDESWFELVTIQAAPRRPLDGIAAALTERERQAGGAERPAAAWWHTQLEVPVAEMAFGAPQKGAGFFADLDLATHPISRLTPDQVLDELKRGL